MTYTGRCSCGAVTLEIGGEPIGVRQCWCRQCQQVAGGGASYNVIFNAEDVAVSGELAAATWVAQSGNTLTHWRCASCGNPVYGQSSARTHIKVVRLGILDAGHGLKPQAVIWTDDAPDWALIDPALESWPQQPPVPPVPNPA